MEADFSGYVTKAGLVCSDGRTIMPDAFKAQHQTKVPLVWQHGQNDSDNILGHVLLENRSDGVYGYGYFNETPKGKNARLVVGHGDVDSLSIYANKLIERAKQVFHGAIREVSLVLSGANPGAKIDFVNIRHSDGEVEELDDEAIIFTGLPLEHSDKPEIPTVPPVQEVPIDPPIQETPKEVVHAMADDEKTVQDVYDELTEEQKNVVHYMIGVALEEATMAQSDDDSNYLEGSEMPRNVFEQQKETNNPSRIFLSHSDVEGIVGAAKRLGSFKEAVEDYALKHGIEDIDVLFPDARSVTSTPDWVSRRTEWVAGVLDGARHTPFSRIKSSSADLTLDEARAKGYVKATLKQEEFFKVSKRTTTPQTIYKKQKLDRDDILDITDFDVVVWLKAEMRLMLEEEIARAVLLGDGRSVGDDDKIKEDNIRPIATDDDFYQTTVYVNINDASSSADEIVDAIIMQRKHYKGTGSPTFYTTEDSLAKLLLAKDTLGRRLYARVEDLAAALRVKDIVPVEAMGTDANTDLIGVIVNMQDYTIGSDRGGEISLFDDFDIDYNQYKYLIESRLSGALTKPKSALVVRKTAGASVLVVPTVPVMEDNEITIPTDANVVYKNAAGSTLTQGSTVTLTGGAPVSTVYAYPASGKYFSTNQDDEWTYTYKA